MKRRLLIRARLGALLATLGKARAGVLVLGVMGLAGGLTACTSRGPAVPSEDAAPLAPAYATAVIAYDEGSGQQDCGDEIPPCGELGTCGPVALLGEPDDAPFELPAQGFVEVAFLCDSLIERGTDNTPELKIWATLPEGARAIVQVAADSASYDEIGELTPETLEFDLARLGLTDARFVRVLNVGTKPISLDAYEALRNP